jgi:hypothetical protein
MANFSNFTSDILYSGTTNKLVPKISSSLNNTDVIAPDFRLYIEGVQVPFQSISINQVYNKLPTADLQIPPERVYWISFEVMNQKYIFFIRMITTEDIDYYSGE